ncbi:MAG: hypothetical protein RQ763_08990 [Sulfurimonas sp.]|uniref:hypothetical protein n=1 Tax=Sulfurimonas sp. TaxID=2022749 RepID=UPI0028CF5B3D|nr:hypothetical protein [Sulfurimonas sp.]MDT8339321.1 hypothetical protein [Sulfurimonas sp.]
MSKTITTVKIYYSGYAEIDIDEDDIKTIATQYKGDYQSFISNLSPSRYDIDFDREDEKYNEEAIVQALNLYSLGTPGLALTFQHSSPLGTFEISKSLFEDMTKDAEELVLDREMLKTIADIADFYTGKSELECVYFGENDIVATDTRRLIAYKNTTQVKDILIHKSICLEYAKNKEARLFRVYDTLYLTADDKYYAHSQSGFGKYPDYERIIPRELKVRMSKDELLQEGVLYREDGNEKQLNCDIRALKTVDGNMLWIDESYLPTFEFESFGYNEAKLPFMFEGKDIRYICMPMFFDDDFASTLKEEQYMPIEIGKCDMWELK